MNEQQIIPRRLEPPDRSFFLSGPRGTGKSTWLGQVLPEALRLDLLDASLFLELSQNPHVLEALIGPRPGGRWVVLDEIQKVPSLLDEVHRLMESRRWRFALCGSSARKLKRGGANLLAGRALTLSMEGFSRAELGDAFDLDFGLDWGMLPFVWNERDAAADILAAYANTYLREEIQAEGLIRNVPPFLRFLGVAGQINGQVLNALNIAREAAVGRSTVETYLSILVDTLVGHYLPTWRPGLKVREAAHPKFYWFDPGVARAAAGLLRDPADRLWQGTALETLVYHELRTYNEVSGKHRPLRTYRTPAGVEIDFIIETARRRPDHPPRVVAVEVKRAERWDRSWDRPMRSLFRSPDVVVEGMIGVYCGSRSYRFDDVLVLPFGDFANALYAGDIF
ncbi:MAG: ATP-binding protein [Candidatus Latescibacteria bacterium]|nr:ATP-binding protein [Candidatus Latescibacterota bacterium]